MDDNRSSSDGELINFHQEERHPGESHLKELLQKVSDGAAYIIFLDCYSAGPEGRINLRGTGSSRKTCRNKGLLSAIYSALLKARDKGQNQLRKYTDEEIEALAYQIVCFLEWAFQWLLTHRTKRLDTSFLGEKKKQRYKHKKYLLTISAHKSSLDASSLDTVTLWSAVNWLSRKEESYAQHTLTQACI